MTAPEQKVDKRRVWSIDYVDPDIYCTSHQHWWINVKLKHRDGRLFWFSYGIPFGFEDWSRAPKYLRDLLHERLRALTTEGKVKIHEHDRDGNKRYEELRYHDQGWWEYLIGLTDKYVDPYETPESEGEV